MSTPARAQLFAVPTLAHDGSSWPLPFERRSQLLVLLALRRGWVGRAEVAALLWPDQDRRLAQTNLRKTLFRLPTLPWGHCVQSQGSALRFDGDTDVAAFESALQAQQIDEALALWRGELLAGFDDDGNEAWTTWLGYERERLRMAWRGAALAWLAGEVPGPAALALSARLLQADPLDEAVLRVHLHWLQHTGQLAVARQVHQRFVERLRDELGLASSASMSALGATLQLPTPLPAPAVPVEPPPVADGPGGAASIDAGFVGRGIELRHIASLLERDECRLLCLLGPGGVGKTRLARRALQEMAQGFAQGTAFLALEDAADATAVGQALARALGVSIDGSSDALSTAIAALCSRHMLLVLDNVETLPSAAPLVRRLLDECRKVKLMLTSRTRLALADEWTFNVEGLPCPDAEDLDRIEAFDAVRLFVRSARRVRPDFEAAAEAAAVADICRQVEGLPLALELTAAWVRVLPCKDIAAELRSGTELLRTEDRTRPPRHASLDLVFDQSWQRLSAAERQALGRLSIFRGGFDAPSARAVASASLAVLASLADKSLLHKDDSRLRLHPLVLQLAAARLPALERAATAQAHAKRYLHLLQRSRREVENGSRQALQQLDLEGDNCRAAWQWATTQGVAAESDAPAGQAQAGTLAQAALTLMHHCDHRGARQQGLAMGLWAVDSPAARRHPPLRAVLLAACAHLQYRLDRLDDAQATAQAALDLADARADRDARVQALRVLAGCQLRLGRLDRARSHYEQALQLAREGVDPRAVASALSNLALVEKRLGRYSEARQLSLDALQALRALGSVADEALCLNNLGDLELIMGALDPAESHLHAALRLCEQHGIRGVHGLALGNLSSVAEQRGDLDAASRHARGALAVLDEVGDRISGSAIRHQLALLELRQGRGREAADALCHSMRDALQIGQPTLQLHGLVVAAAVMAASDDAAAAALLDFVAAHPTADAPLREEARVRRSALAAPSKAAPWPQDLALAEAAERIANDPASGIEQLRQRIRGDSVAGR
jgi:predicted ATPase/DNA-binding SARP family transcriptional activator